MKAGELRHRITINQKVTTQDPVTGEQLESWVQWARPWAKFEPLSVKDFIASQSNQSQIVARARIRYRDGLDPKMRVNYRGKDYSISGILPDPDSGLEYVTLPLSEEL